jgi:hypothetical protein
MSEQSRDRRFTVSGLDGTGDVHVFATDDPASAEAMRVLMGEELSDVTLLDREG